MSSALRVGIEGFDKLDDRGPDPPDAISKVLEKECMFLGNEKFGYMR